MNIEEIIKGIERVNRKYSASVMGLPDAEECEDIAALRAAIALLRTHLGSQPNAPLTLDELREMDGEPVWANKIKQWAFVSVFEGTVSLVDRDGLCYTIKMAEPIYRRRPEEETK